MKKKGIFIGIAVVIIVALVVLVLTKMNSGPTALITLDINPSLELEFKSGKVVNARALNEDAQDYVAELEGKKLDEAFDIIIKRAQEHNLVENGNVAIILGMESNNKKIEEALKKACDDNQVNANIIVPVITEEAKNEAKARGVTPAKAAYVQEIVKDNEEIRFEDVVDKPAAELNEMKETGKYCDAGYTLVGDFCEKRIREEKPQESKVCPEGYEDINNNCYLKSETTKEPYCSNGLALNGNKCEGTTKVDATGKCSTGTYNSKTQKCEVLTYVSAGTKKCREAEDLLLDNGKCASHHMGAHFDDPGATIDPATECCCGDTYKNGWCYSLPNGNYDATITCPSGSQLTTGDNGKGCYKTESSNATFTCSNGTLEGTKCIVPVSKNPEYKLSCNNGLKLYQDRICIDYNNTKNYNIGYVCDKEAKLIDNHCVYFDVVEAKNK